MPEASKLSDMDITKVDLVDRPSNPDSKIMLFKSEDGEKTLLESVKKVLETLGFKKQEATPDPVSVIEEENVEKGCGTKMPMDKMSKEKRIKELEMQLAELKGEKMQKSESEIPESIKKMLDDSNARAEAAEVELKKIRDEKELETFVAKAKEFDKLSVEADAFGKVLKTISDADKEAYESVVSVLKGANEFVKEDNFVEVGKSGTHEDTNGTSDTMEIITKKAVEKYASENITKQKAIAKFLVTPEGKKLYEEHLKGGN